MTGGSAYLFVGGSLDGQVVTLAGRPATYTHHARMDEQRIRESYVLEPVEAERLKVFYIYRHDALTMGEVVMRLISAYAEVRR